MPVSKVAWLSVIKLRQPFHSAGEIAPTVPHDDRYLAKRSCIILAAAIAPNDTTVPYVGPSRDVVRSFQHAADVHEPSVEARNGYPHVDCSSTFLPRRLEQDRSRCTMLLSLPPPSFLHVGRSRLGSQPPAPPRLLTANISSTVTVDRIRR